jgi:hypothetical protein
LAVCPVDVTFFLGFFLVSPCYLIVTLKEFCLAVIIVYGLNNLSKKIYAMQPYQVGPKHKKSLAVIIPSKLAKEYRVDTSTIFATYVDKTKKTISLQMVRTSEQDMITGESLV